MTRVVFYGRFSSDRQNESSIADQFRNCKKYANQQKWEIALRFEDHAISGTTAQRAEYQKMLAAAQAGEIDVILVDDTSRLSRDMGEMATTAKRLDFWGVRLIGVSDGTDSTDLNFRMQIGLKGILSEQQLEFIRRQTHRGLEGQAIKGLNTGGKTYGYRNVPIEDTSRTDEYGRPAISGVRKEIDPDQADVVKTIFAYAAEGRSSRWIASELNKRGIPSPRGTTWAGTAIRPLIRNETYIGKAIWNRSQWIKNPDTGKRRRILRPRNEWTVVELPELRIVPDDLWRAVRLQIKEQQAKTEAVLHGRTEAGGKGNANDRARYAGKPKHLLTGILKCAVCGANYITINAYQIGCSTNRNRGPAACANDVRIPRRVVEERIINFIKSDLFTSDGVEHFKLEVHRILTERQSGKNAEHEKAKKELARIETEIGNLVTIIKLGKAVPSITDEIERLEEEKVNLERAVKVDTDDLTSVDELLPESIDKIMEMIPNLDDTEGRDVTRARNYIKALVGGSITMRPTSAGGLRAELAGSYRGFFDIMSNHPGSQRARVNKFGVVAGARNHRELTLQVMV
jgi:site-specific DNA recombinase